MHWIDPAQLPMISGIIERFIVDGQGEPDGLVLSMDSGVSRLVHFPSHMADDVRAAVKPGDRVGIRGLKLRDADVIAAVAIECTNGVQILDHGPSKKLNHRISSFKFAPMSGNGTIRLTIFTPKGKVRGALLEDGTIVRMPLKLAEQVKERLRPGQMIEVTGVGLDTSYGRIIEVQHFGAKAPRLAVTSRPKRVHPRT
jgi:hypothetical protein